MKPSTKKPDKKPDNKPSQKVNARTKLPPLDHMAKMDIINTQPASPMLSP